MTKTKKNITSTSSVSIDEEILNNEDDLFLFAKNLTKNNKEKAEDLLQHTFYKAIKNKHNFKKNTNVKGWLFTIMKNTFINEYRKTKREVDTDDDLSSVFITLSSGHSKSDELVDINLLKKRMRELSKDLFTPLDLYHKGYSYKEIEKHTGVPIGTIKSRIHLARKKLAKKMEINNISKHNKRKKE